MKKMLQAAAAALVILSTCSCQNQASNDDLKNVDIVSSTINIKAVGDNLLNSDLLKYSKDSEGNYNFDPMYENIKSYIESADIAVVNQETPLIKDNKRASGYPSFGTPANMSDTLARTGFDVILHANNHVADKEESGFNDTISNGKRGTGLCQGRAFCVSYRIRCLSDELRLSDEYWKNR